MAGDSNWSSVVALVHFDGPNASTSFHDSSLSNHSISEAFGGQIGTAQAAFGTASADFVTNHGSGPCINISENGGTDFQFGSGDFTIECWVYPTGGNNGWIMQAGVGGSGAGAWGLQYNSSTPALIFTYSTDGSTNTNISGTTTLALNTWTHVAADYDGSTLRVYAGGSVVGSGTLSGALFATTQPISIGDDNHTDTGPWTGYIDEIRVTNGVARYAGGFTPPSAAFPAYGTSPQPENVAQSGNGAGNGNATNASITYNVTTWEPNDILVVAVFNENSGTGNPATVASITSSGLSFAQRSIVSATNGGGMEVWWALAATPLIAQSMTIAFTGSFDDASSVAFGVAGCYTPTPWDGNGSLPATASGFSITGVSTTSADDCLLSFVGSESSPGNPFGYTPIVATSNFGGALGSALTAGYQDVSSTQSSLSPAAATGTFAAFIIDALTSDVGGTNASPSITGAAATGAAGTPSAAHVSAGITGVIAYGEATVTQTALVGDPSWTVTGTWFTDTSTPTSQERIYTTTFGSSTNIEVVFTGDQLAVTVQTSLTWGVLGIFASDNSTLLATVTCDVDTGGALVTTILTGFGSGSHTIFLRKTANDSAFVILVSLAWQQSASSLIAEDTIVIAGAHATGSVGTIIGTGVGMTGVSASGSAGMQLAVVGDPSWTVTGTWFTDSATPTGQERIFTSTFGSSDNIQAITYGDLLNVTVQTSAGFGDLGIYASDNTTLLDTVTCGTDTGGLLATTTLTGFGPGGHTIFLRKTTGDGLPVVLVALAWQDVIVSDSAALTGPAGTGQAGSPHTEVDLLPLAGVAGAGQVGAIKPDPSPTPSGVEGESQAGTLTQFVISPNALPVGAVGLGQAGGGRFGTVVIESDVPIFGVEGDTQVGAPQPVPLLIGVTATGQAGVLTALPRFDNSVSLSGAVGIGQAGTVIGAFDDSIAIAGVEGESQAGLVALALAVTPTGVEGDSHAGSFTEQYDASASVTGVEGESRAGAPIPSYDDTASLTGVEGDTQVGTVIPSVAKFRATTWNPLDLGASASLSSDQLTFTSLVTAGVRSTRAHNSGRWYFEVPFTGTDLEANVGIANLSWPNSASVDLGYDNNSLSLYFLGAIVLNGVNLASANLPELPGSIYGFAIDFDAQLIWVTATAMRAGGFNWNYSLTANPSTGVGGISFAGMNAGPYFIAGELTSSGTTPANLVLNVGTSAFTYGEPIGFLSWDGTIGTSAIGQAGAMGIEKHTGLIGASASGLAGTPPAGPSVAISGVSTIGLTTDFDTPMVVAIGGTAGVSSTLFTITTTQDVPAHSDIFVVVTIAGVIATVSDTQGAYTLYSITNLVMLYRRNNTVLLPAGSTITISATLTTLAAIAFYHYPTDANTTETPSPFPVLGSSTNPHASYAVTPVSSEHKFAVAITSILGPITDTYSGDTADGWNALGRFGTTSGSPDYTLAVGWQFTTSNALTYSTTIGTTRSWTVGFDVLQPTTWAQPDVTPTPSGVSGVGHAGTILLASNSHLTLTGVGATGSSGTVTAKASILIAGVAGTRGAGQTLIEVDATSIGVAGDATAGSFGDVADVIFGVFATAMFGLDLPDVGPTTITVPAFGLAGTPTIYQRTQQAVMTICQ